MTQAQFTVLVPMKGHNERVPGKNLRHLGGVPLYHHIVRALQAVDLVKLIVINTDNEQIADDVRQNFPDVRVHDRPDDLCGDHVSMNRIIDHDVANTDGEYYMQTHSTNPLVRPATLRGAMEAMVNASDFDSIFSVTPHLARFYDHEGKPINHDTFVLRRTQDMLPLYEENSNFFVFTRTSFEKHANRIGDRPHLFPVSKLDAIDIDTEQDFWLAEAVLSHRQRIEPPE